VAKSVLVLGFEPFGGHDINPSELIVRSMEGRRIAGLPISAHVLPVETRSLRGRLDAIVEAEQPVAILALGQAGGRASIGLERIAVNVLDFSSPDNAGETRNRQPISATGPAARFASLPFDAIMESWRERNIPADLSTDAGRFLCNQVLYELLAITQDVDPPVPVGFIHLPYLPEQAAVAGSQVHPSMRLETMQQAFDLLVEIVVARTGIARCSSPAA